MDTEVKTRAMTRLIPILLLTGVMVGQASTNVEFDKFVFSSGCAACVRPFFTSRTCASTSADPCFTTGPLTFIGYDQKFCFEAKGKLICAGWPKLPIPEALRRKP